MEDRVITSTYTMDDQEIETSLRPRKLDEYVGQSKAKQNLKELAKEIKNGSQEAEVY